MGRKMSETKREEIALNAVDLSELNQRRPAVSSDSALPLNIPSCERWTDRATTTDTKKIKNRFPNPRRERNMMQNATHVCTQRITARQFVILCNDSILSMC